MSKSENYPQAILSAQGRKAAGGDTEGLSDVEVRRKGLKRLAFKAGALASAGVIMVGGAVIGLRKQDGVNAAQARADSIAFEHTKFGGHEAGTTDPAPEAGTGGAAAETTGADLSTDGGAGGVSTETAPATVIPSEGAWAPTPNATSTAPAETGTTVAAPQAGAPEAATGTGGVAPEGPTGGLEPR